MKKHIIYLFLFSFSLGFSQQIPKIAVAIDTTQIRIGEQFEYQISIDKKEEVTFPVLSNLGLLEAVSSAQIDTLKNKLVKKYTLTGFDSGSFYIPKQQLFIKDKTYYTDSLLIKVANISVDTVKQKAFDKKPIAKEPFVFADFKPYFNWFYLGIGCVTLLISLFFLLRRKAKKAKIETLKIPAYQEAIDKFTSLDEKDLLENDKIKEYYIELTEIIRVYLGKEVNVHTLEATTDELIALLKHENSAKDIGITKESISQLQVFLKHADFVKFAKLRPSSGEVQNDRNVAATIVQEMQPLLDKFTLEQKRIRESLEIEQKPKKEFSFKKLSQQSKIFIAILVFAILVVSFFGYQIYKTAQITKGADTIVKTAEEDEAEGWSVQRFGEPALLITAPGLIELKSDEVPLPIQSVVSEFENYLYKGDSDTSEISVITLLYLENNNPDVEQVVQSSIANLEKTQKIEDLEYERQPASVGDDIRGVYLKGSYMAKGIKRGFNLLGFSKGNRIWQVFTNVNLDNNEASTAMDTAIESIKFEKE